ncbi:MAG: TenA family transcriptional regulator [Bacteroidota bacterium]
MKRSKNIHLDTDFTDTHQLSAATPSEDSLFWELWRNAAPIAQKALHTKYIQGIKDGTLDPNVYTRYNISDAYYCYRGPDDYAAAAQRAKHPTLQAFLAYKQQHYANYDASLPKLWRVQSAKGIIPSDVCKEYANYESAVARGTLPILKNLQDPIYTLIVMLPCEYLWAWLGQQLSPPIEGNLYGFWINGNNDPSGAYKIGNFIHEYEQTHAIDHDVTNEIYTQAMRFEYLNFETAE